MNDNQQLNSSSKEDTMEFDQNMTSPIKERRNQLLIERNSYEGVRPHNLEGMHR